MLCDNCGKNPATVHLTEIIDGQMNELHLCEECSKKKSAQMEQQFGLSDLLAGMADFGKQGKGHELAVKTKCPNCSLSYEDFKKLGRLGCSECYSSFRKFLAPLLKKIHGSGQHLGKTPFKIAKVSKKKISEVTMDDLDELRIKLQRAIDAEEFEEAAKIRDQIKALDKKGQNEVK